MADNVVWLFPDIVGTVDAVDADTGAAPTGTFYKIRTYSSNARGGGKDDSWGKHYGFSAKNANAIYGRVSTVQPPAINALIIIKI